MVTLTVRWEDRAGGGGGRVPAQERDIVCARGHAEAQHTDTLRGESARKLSSNCFVV